MNDPAHLDDLYVADLSGRKVESINWQVYWFDRYINGNANAVPPDAPARTAAGTSQDRP